MQKTVLEGCDILNKKKLLSKLLRSSKNIRFNDLVIIANAFGFFLARVEGSHHIFKNNEIAEIINLQNVSGEAKPYQIKQFLALVEKYDLKLED